MAWGVVGLYLLVLVELTSLGRRRLSVRHWRSMHILSYPLFAVATVHFLTAGTDAYHWIPFWLSVVFGGAVVIASMAGYNRAHRLADEAELRSGG